MLPVSSLMQDSGDAMSASLDEWNTFFAVPLELALLLWTTVHLS